MSAGKVWAEGKVCIFAMPSRLLFKFIIEEVSSGNYKYIKI